jgi:hypothetical protein
MEMLKNRIKRGILESCHKPYRNPWFIMKKKNRKYRLVNHAAKLNKYIIRDANLPPNVNTFSEKFVGCAVIFLINFFSGYDHVKLDPKYKDMTAFMISLGLLKQTTILQKATNSIAQFVRIVTKILKKHIPHVYLPFINNINIKGPKTTYNNKKIIPGIRKYILKHIIWMNRILTNLKRTECTISGAKSQFCMPKLRIIRFIYDTLKRYPDISKIIKIIK